MTRSLTLALMTVLLAAAGSMTGCVAQQHADDQARTIRTLQERITELQAQLDQKDQQIAMLQGSESATSQEVRQLQRQRDQLQQRINALQAQLSAEDANMARQLADLRNKNEQLRAENARLAAAGDRPPPEVQSALKQFAQRYPNLARYDQRTGVVEFASDLTFKLGSADLSDAAKQAIARLAEILNVQAARDYEVRIVGHTDSVPIKKPATREKHPTNWHLSVHRAIAVRDALNAAGVADVRTAVAGYSKYRPAAQNTRRGAEANRRVEIYLAHMPPVNESYLVPAGGGNNGGGDAGGNNNDGGGNAGNTGGVGSRPADDAEGPGALFK